MVGVLVEVPIVVSDMAVGLLMGALTGRKLGVRNSIGVDVLVDVNVYMLSGITTAFETANPGPLEECC